MIFQPFAENSLKHGLATKEGNRFLKIELHKNETSLHCIIEDNGIGRSRSADLKTTLKKEHNSKGMQITGERLKLISAKNRMEVHFDVTDLYGSDGQPAGTRVEIAIPHENENYPV